MINETIVEDNDVIVLAPKKSFVAGQLSIIPKTKEMILEQVGDESIKKIFQVANKLSSVLFDATGCQGTNILIQNGVPSGQINDVFSVSVIPRKENDSLSLEWTPKQASNEELDFVVKKFKLADEEEVQKKMLAEKKNKFMEKEEDVMKSDEDNYLIKSLRRQP